MSNSDEFTAYGIALIPDPATCMAALGVNRQLWNRQVDPPIVLGLSETMRDELLVEPDLTAKAWSAGFIPHVPFPGTLPHITILQKMIRSEHLERLVAAVANGLQTWRDSAHGATAISGGFFGYEIFQNYVFRMVAIDDAMIGLHYATLDAVQSIDADCTMPLPNNPDDADLEPWRKYGYPYAGKNFRPHITLARLRPDLIEAMNDAPPFPSVFDDLLHRWHAKRVVISRLGPSGTIQSDDIVLSLDGTVIKTPQP